MIPNAPYIEKAERFGMPHPEQYECPACGRVCRTIFIRDREVIGCNLCVREYDPEEWEAMNDGE